MSDARDMNGRPKHIEAFLASYKNGQWFDWSDIYNKVYKYIVSLDGTAIPSEADCIAGLKAMKIRKYKMKDDVAKGDSDANWRLGVIAQELEASNMNGLVVDETKYTEDDQDVAINKTANAGDIKSYKSVKYSILYMKAIKALQEAMAKIETLETIVKALEDA